MKNSTQYLQDNNETNEKQESKNKFRFKSSGIPMLKEIELFKVNRESKRKNHQRNSAESFPKTEILKISMNPAQ